jgi:hypothetical protein
MKESVAVDPDTKKLVILQKKWLSKEQFVAKMRKLMECSPDILFVSPVVEDKEVFFKRITDAWWDALDGE